MKQRLGFANMRHRPFSSQRQDFTFQVQVLPADRNHVECVHATILQDLLHAQNTRRRAATDVNRRWQARMAEYFESGSDVRGEGVRWLDQYFHLK